MMKRLVQSEFRKHQAFLKGLFAPHFRNSAVKTQKIQTGNSDQAVNNSCNPCHIAKQQIDEIKPEKSDQSPVDSADNDKRQRCVIKTSAHSDSSFLPHRMRLSSGIHQRIFFSADSIIISVNSV